MKIPFFLLLTVLSFSSFPGDKGNLSPVIVGYSSVAHERLFEMFFEMEEKFYTPLASKKLVSRNGQIAIVGMENLEDNKLTGKYISLIAELIERNDREFISPLVSENDLFLKAFSLTELNNSIASTEGLSKEEKAQLSKSAADLVNAFFDEFHAVLKSRVGEEKANKFIEELRHLSKL